MYGQNSEASKDVTRIVFQLLKGQSYEKKLSCRHLLMLVCKNGEEECFSYSQKKQFSDKKMKKVSKDAQGKSCGSIAR